MFFFCLLLIILSHPFFTSSKVNPNYRYLNLNQFSLNDRRRYISREMINQFRSEKTCSNDNNLEAEKSKFLSTWIRSHEIFFATWIETAEIQFSKRFNLCLFIMETFVYKEFGFTKNRITFERKFLGKKHKKHDEKKKVYRKYHFCQRLKTNLNTSLTLASTYNAMLEKKSTFHPSRGLCIEWFQSEN